MAESLFLHHIRVIQKVLLLKRPSFLSSCCMACLKGLLLTACTKMAHYPQVQASACLEWEGGSRGPATSL